MAKDKHKNTFGNVMGAICGILVGGYIVVLATASTYSPYSNNYEGKTYLRYINRNEYNMVVENAQSDRRFRGSKGFETESTKQFYAVADYVEAAFMYKAYKEVGNTAKTEEYAAKIGEAQKGLGSLDFIKEDVNEILGIK